MKIPGVLLGLLSLVPISGLAQSQSDWFFDVEVIVFTHNQKQVDENFSAVVEPIDISSSADILSATLVPDLSLMYQALPLCEPEDLLPMAEIDLAATSASSTATDNTDSKQYNQSVINGMAPDRTNLDDATPDDSTPDDSTPVTPLNNPASIRTYSDNVNDQNILALEPVQPLTEADTRQATNDYDMFWWYTPTKWQDYLNIDCHSNEPMPFRASQRRMPPEVPRLPAGRDTPYPRDFHLQPQTTNELNDLYRQIARRRGTAPMLHMTWRQKVVFGKENATPIRLIGGKNFSEEFDYWGLPRAESQQEQESGIASVDLLGPIELDVLPRFIAKDEPQTNTAPELDIVAKVEQALLNTQRPAILDRQEALVRQQFEGTLPSQVWELDGLFKVYLQYVNRVPYLHIDSRLNYRKPEMLSISAQSEPQLLLRSYRFSQLRRVISTQIHYFDHPYFGMVVQIRRYRPPQDSE